MDNLSHAARTDTIRRRRGPVKRNGTVARPIVAVSADRRGIIRRLVAAVIVLSAVVNVAAGVLSLVAPAAFLAAIGHRGERLTTGTHIFAAYTGARELALGVTLLVLLALRSTRVLPSLLAMTALANALDGVAALASQRWEQAPGPVVFAIILLVAARCLFVLLPEEAV